MRLPHILALLAYTALSGAAQAGETVTHWRLFVSDHAEARISVIDLPEETEIETFALAFPATLHVTDDGTGVFAVEGAANRVTAIRSGIAFEHHGDHADLKVSAPDVVASAIEGERPVHFVEHDGEIAVFFDGSGRAALVDSKDWLNDAPKPAELATGKPHHGVAVPWHDGAVVSRPVPGEGTLPSGFLVFDEKGDLVGETELCADAHGEAISGDILAFGCSDGVLIARGKAPDFQILPYPEGADQRVGTLLGGRAMHFFLASFGTRQVALIEADAADPFRLVDLPFERVHFTLDHARPRFAYLLLSNGALHELDVVAGTLGRSLPVTEPYATDGGHAAAMPRLAVAGDTLVVSDPAAGRLHLIDTATLAKRGEIDIGGTPASIVAVGGMATAH